MTRFLLAIDIGASSGRHVVGEINDDNILLHEVYRFPNGIIKKEDEAFWDIESIFKNVVEGIKVAISLYPTIESLAIDTWGVDYVLLNEDKEILPVNAYRSKRTSDVIKQVHKLIPFEKLYELTGTQFQPFNTIYQLFKDKKDSRLDLATDYLMIPEYLSYRLTGVKYHEYTNASTTGLMDLKDNVFNEEIINKLGLKKSLFTKLIKPGANIGYLLPHIKEYVGKDLLVKVCASHDTASAVESIKMDVNAPYISSGTWSLIGIKINSGINTKKAREANFANEYGPNYIRFQKNIMGLWIIQNLAKELGLSFIEMVELARNSNYKEIYDVNDQVFLSSDNMKQTIIDYLKAHNKKPPTEDKDIISSTYHSLAYSYKIALEELSDITGTNYDSLYIVGGGAKNEYLNELTRLYTGKKVIALPIEATALGNIISQQGDNYEKRN